MAETGSIRTSLREGVGEILFHHPRSNSLPLELLHNIAEALEQFAVQDEARVIVIKSEGDKVFCGGAAFDELQSITTPEQGYNFFMGFARVILAIKRAPKFVLARVQGKAVGGGVGLIAACDYALASHFAAVRLTELALGFGPFVISAAVKRKIGPAAFSALSIDRDWRDAAWCLQHGLFSRVFPGIKELDQGVSALAQKLATYNPEAMRRLKEVFWEGTESWDELLSKRARYSAELVLSEFASSAIKAAMERR